MDRKAGDIRTMTARYVQVKKLSLLDETPQVTGTVRFRREDRTIRWKEDGTGAIQQIQGDRYVVVYPRLKEVEIFTLDQRGKHLAAVMGAPEVSETLRRDFEVTIVSRNEEEIQLRLAPRSDDMKKRVREARLKVSAKSYLLNGASYVEPNGDAVEITFSDSVVNEKIDPREFELDLASYEKLDYKITKR